MLRIANVTFIPGRSSLAIIDGTLSGEARVRGRDARRDDGTTFDEKERAARCERDRHRQFQLLAADADLTVRAGTKVTRINNDDVPHLIVNIQRRFKQSSVLDTDQRFSATLTAPGTYDYFCSLHPKMQGKIIVQP